MGDTTKKLERVGVVLDMPEDEYHGGDELSSSAAKAIMKSPRHYEYTYLQGHSVSNSSFDLGTAVHAKLLGVGAEVVSVPEEYLSSDGGVRSKEAKEWKATAEGEGKVVLAKKTVAEMNAIAESVLSHPYARALLEAPGTAETSVFSTCPETGVKMRCRFDKLNENGLGVDLKTTKDVEPWSFAMAVKKLGYDLQHGHYLQTAQYAGLEVPEMLFIAVGTSAPYIPMVYQLDADYVEMGARKAKVARERLLRHLESGHWPGYSEQIESLRPPIPAIAEYEDLLEAEGAND